MTTKSKKLIVASLFVASTFFPNKLRTEEDVVKFTEYTVIKKPIENVTETGLYKMIQKASNKYNISPFLIESIIKNESDYKPDAVSSKGAIGLMQVMPTSTTYSKDALRNPQINIYAGTEILKEYLRTYKNLDKALMAYNAGDVAVKSDNVPKSTRRYVYHVKIDMNKFIKKQHAIKKNLRR